MRNGSLEAAIAADPNEDAPYLVYADWFEEQGDTRRAAAMRVLGGGVLNSAESIDAGRLVLAVAIWLDERASFEDFEWESFSSAASPDAVRAARRNTRLVPLFLEAWGHANPFEVDDSLSGVFAQRVTVDRALELPSGARLEEVAFTEVPINQNGTIGLSGALLWATCEATTAFDLLATRLTFQAIEDVRGRDRLDAFDDATDWVPLSRAQAYSTLFSTLAANEGHGLRRGSTEVDLVGVLAELGPLRAATFSQTEFTWQLMQFERGWLAFYVTF